MTNQDPGIGRAPNKSSSVYKGGGRWHGRVSMGDDDEGRPDRRQVTGATRTDVTRKVRDLEKLRDSGRAATAARAPQVSVWLSHWLENNAARTVRPRTLDGYRTYIERYAVWVSGRIDWDRLQPEHIEALYPRMQRSGLTHGTMHSLHRILRNALNEAVRRDKLTRNPVSRARPPRLTEREMEPLTREAARLIRVAGGQPDGARWSVALALGASPGRGVGSVLGRSISMRAPSASVERCSGIPRSSAAAGPAGAPARLTVPTAGNQVIADSLMSTYDAHRYHRRDSIATSGTWYVMIYACLPYSGVALVGELLIDISRSVFASVRRGTRRRRPARAR